MIDRNVVLAKVDIIRRSLYRIQTKTEKDPNRFDDPDIQNIFVLNLQRAIQAAVDLWAHVIAEEELGLPGSLRDIFQLLHEAGILPKVISKQMQRMVIFRNIAIHEYKNLDLAVLKRILTDPIGDLIRFERAILQGMTK